MTSVRFVRSVVDYVENLYGHVGGVDIHLRIIIRVLNMDNMQALIFNMSREQGVNIRMCERKMGFRGNASKLTQVYAHPK